MISIARCVQNDVCVNWHILVTLVHYPFIPVCFVFPVCACQNVHDWSDTRGCMGRFESTEIGLWTLVLFFSNLKEYVLPCSVSVDRPEVAEIPLFLY